MNNWPTDSELDALFEKHEVRFENRWDLGPHLAFEADFRALLQTFIGLPQEERLLITEYMKESHRLQFIGFAASMSVRALNEQSVERIAEGLIALAAEGSIYDGRLSQSKLITLYNGILVLGADPVAIFERALPYANQTSWEHLAGFLKKPIPIEDMHLKLEHRGERGYLYMPTR